MQFGTEDFLCQFFNMPTAFNLVHQSTHQRGLCPLAACCDEPRVGRLWKALRWAFTLAMVWSSHWRSRYYELDGSLNPCEVPRMLTGLIRTIRTHGWTYTERETLHSTCWGMPFRMIAINHLETILPVTTVVMNLDTLHALCLR